MFQRRLDAGDIDADLFLATAEALIEGIYEGYPGFAEAEFGGPYFPLLTELRHNAHVFSSFKGHQFTAAVAELLVDGTRTRPWEEFRDLAARVSAVYNEAWLNAEYNTAISTGQMAAKWVELTSDPAFPNLKYITAGDDRVRDEHRPLDGVVQPADSAFWDSYYPPNGWNCRCDVMATDEAATAQQRPPLPAGFQNNPGKTGRIYSQDHPYFDTQKREQIEDEAARVAHRPKNWAKTTVNVPDRYWRWIRHKTDIKLSQSKSIYKSAYAQPGRISLPAGSREWKTSNGYLRATVTIHEHSHSAHLMRGIITSQNVSSQVKDVYEQCRRLLEQQWPAQQDIVKRLTDWWHIGAAGMDIPLAVPGMSASDKWIMLHGLLDTIASLTGGTKGIGHSIFYFTRGNSQYMEFLVHAAEFRYAGNPLMEYLFPEIYRIMADTVDALSL